MRLHAAIKQQLNQAGAEYSADSAILDKALNPIAECIQQQTSEVLDGVANLETVDRAEQKVEAALLDAISAEPLNSFGDKRSPLDTQQHTKLIAATTARIKQRASNLVVELSRKQENESVEFAPPAPRPPQHAPVRKRKGANRVGLTRTFVFESKHQNPDPGSLEAAQRDFALATIGKLDTLGFSNRVCIRALGQLWESIVSVSEHIAEKCDLVEEDVAIELMKIAEEHDPSEGLANIRRKTTKAIVQEYESVLVGAARQIEEENKGDDK